nr:MAG TPA: tail protein [Caudoviricetes sp.]
MSVITRVIKFLRVGVGISNTDVEYAESTSQTTAPTEGWQTTAPQWRKGYYIWSRTHFYYTDGSEKVSTPMCHGAAGKDAINIQLSMSSIVHKKSQFVGSYSIDVQAFEAGMEIGCIVSCDLTKDTTGVSMRSVKYKKGRRLLITIEKNTIVNDALDILVGVNGISYTYKVPIITVEDGEPGAKGETGATLRGPQSWSNCGNGYSFQAGAAGEEWKDVVFYDSGFYSCIKSHVKSATNYPGSDEDTNNGYWRLGSPFEMVVANLILSQFQIVENLGVRTIEMKDKDGNVVFRAKDGNLDCKGGIFQNVSVSGDVSVGRLRYNENTVTDGTSVINGSFIMGWGTYVLPHLKDGEFMRIVVFNPIISRNTMPAVLKGEQTGDDFMPAKMSYTHTRETTIEVYGWYELIGTNELGHTIWVYNNVENNQN